MMKKAIRAIGSAWGQRITLLVLICIVMAIAEPVFFKLDNYKSILLAIAVNGVMVCGMLFTVLVGGMDLSVGAMAGISASIAYRIAESSGFTTSGFLSGCALALALCLVAGAVSGLLVTRFALPAFVVTLAMKYIVYGSIYLVTQGFFVLPPAHGLSYQVGNQIVFSIPVGGGNKLNIPMPVIILIIVVAICAFVLVKTTYGRKLYAIGGNKNVANLVGIKSNANIVGAFMISGVLAGIAGIMLASMNGQAGQTTALNYEGNVLMAMVVGGVNLAGGEGGVAGAIFGALFVGIINNVMVLLSVEATIQTFVRGIVILAAMTLNMYARRGSTGAMKIKIAKADKAA
ncbi:MAG: ABC transporter permease [Oscillospiraceae bacterium]|nr:ABC transporter permease [Oscillospiraceae bacterium]